MAFRAYHRRDIIQLMRNAVLLGWLSLACFAPNPSQAQNRSSVPPMPEQFEIGRLTFFDFGPPFDYYELIVVRPLPVGVSAERILLTAPGDKCFAPAKVETAHATLNETVSTLLGEKNPCAIPEKDLKHEQKRCKKCLVFSGADVVLQVKCGDNMRLIHSKIMDRDIFSKNSNTPENTSWTMRLLEKLDGALGPGVMEKPAFSTLQPNAPPAPESPTMRDVAQGKYDQLFPRGTDKASDIYRESFSSPPTPTVSLLSSSPLAPETFVAPLYPVLARDAHVEGVVIFTLKINPQGLPIDLTFLSGSPLLRRVIEDASSNWRYPQDAAGQQILASIEFKLNCPR